MMKIAVQTAGVTPDDNADIAYRIIKEAGFDAVDVAVDHVADASIIKERRIPEAIWNATEADVIEMVRPYKEASKKYGIDNYQCHGIFPSYWQGAEDEPELNDWITEMQKKNIRAAASIDCQRIVIHPNYRRWDYRLNDQQLFELNMERYQKLVPTAKEYGVKILLENMFYTAHPGGRTTHYAGVCGNVDQAVLYVDELNRLAGEKVFGFCFDTGHSLLGHQDIYRMVTKLGDRIEAFHTHDNSGLNDDHMPPYFGILEWDAFLKALADIGYDKTLSFETFATFNKDYEAGLLLLPYIANVGRLFAKRVEELRNQK